MYVANPQARPGALESMDLACLTDLRKKGSVTTTRFKTAETYGYQTIVVGAATLKLLEYWVRCFRPTIASSSSETRLFLTSTGNPHTSLGKLVTEFFRPWDLHITTNAIRCLQETESAAAFKQDVITPEERDAVTMFQGHSSSTSRLYYQKEKMSDISESAINAHRTIYGEIISTLPDLADCDGDLYRPDSEEVGIISYLL